VPRPDALPSLHVVTVDAVLARPGFAEAARAVLAAGGPGVALHLRGPGTGGAALFALAEALAPAAREAGSWLMVNDRADVALATGADGVQLGARSLSIAQVRGLAGGGRLRIGRSVHAPGAAREAAAEGADFVLAGTVHPTPSHPERRGAGEAYVARCAEVGVPVVAIGGVTPVHVAALRRAGAAGIAVVRGVWDADDPAGAARTYLSAWMEHG
jgi:thiamine-phosphate diphosphorylase